LEEITTINMAGLLNEWIKAYPIRMVSKQPDESWFASPGVRVKAPMPTRLARPGAMTSDKSNEVVILSPAERKKVGAK